tara:strand:- start:689 stop:877 length:189 start_codon:yes stop_codon:yes gene_type:complete
MTVVQSAKGGKDDLFARRFGTSNEGALGFRDLSAVNRRWLQTTVYFPELISHLDNSSNPREK